MFRILAAATTLMLLSAPLAQARKAQSLPTTFTPAQQAAYTACMNAAKAKAGDGANKNTLMKQAEVSCKAKAKG